MPNSLKLCCMLNGFTLHPSCKCGFKLCRPCEDQLRGGRSENPSWYFVGLNILADVHFSYDNSCPRFIDEERRDYFGEGTA